MAIAKVNGLNINYRVEGAGEPLVMISGFSMTLTQWRRQVPLLKQYYQVITFDNRGVGLSDKPKGPYSIKIMADDVIQLMDYLKIDKANILGGSMGTLVAQEIAANYPQRVNKLILSSAWACQDEKDNGFTPEVLEATQLPFRQRIFRFADTLFNNPFNRFILIPLYKMQVRRMKESQITGLMGQASCLVGFNSVGSLSSIKAPTLVIAGTNDRLVKQPGSSETIARKIPNAKLVKINKGSHALPMEATKIFNQEVLKFLKGN